MSVIVIGVGNPIMGDDAIGILTLEELRKISNRTDTTFMTAQLSGIPLAEMLIGYDKAIIIDSIIKTECRYGELCHLKSPKNSNQYSESMHTIGFHDAIHVLERHSARMPDAINIYAINIKFEQVVSDKISEELAGNIPDYALEIANIEGLIEVKKVR